MIRNRVESGSHLLTYLTHWLTEQSGFDPHITYLWTACKKFSMDFFILGTQTKMIMKSLDTICFKTAWDNKFDCIHQTQSSLTYQMVKLFFKEHVISWSQLDNLAYGWDPLDPLKSDPSDLDCPGLSDPLSTLISN